MNPFKLLDINIHSKLEVSVTGVVIFLSWLSSPGSSVMALHLVRLTHGVSAIMSRAVATPGVRSGNLMWRWLTSGVQMSMGTGVHDRDGAREVNLRDFGFFCALDPTCVFQQVSPTHIVQI